MEELLKQDAMFTVGQFCSLALRCHRLRSDRTKHPPPAYRLHRLKLRSEAMHRIGQIYLPLTPAIREERSPAPRAWVVDKTHVQKFLRSILEELGFAADIWDESQDIDPFLDDPPELIVIGPSFKTHALDFFEKLSVRNATASILLIGPSDSRALTGLARVGEEFGLTILPILATPFHERTLRRMLLHLLQRQFGTDAHACASLRASKLH